MKRVTNTEIIAAGLRVLLFDPAGLTEAQKKAVLNAALLLKAQEAR